MTLRSPSAVWRNKLQAVVVILVCVVGIVFAIGLLIQASYNSAAISAYESAMPCNSPPQAASSDRCRYDGEANVLSVSRDMLLTAVVSFDSIPDRKFTTSFATDSEPARGALTAGAKVPATLWSGRVTKLAGAATVNDPRNSLTSTNVGVAAIVGLLAIAGLVAGGLMARAAWRPST